MKKIMFAIRAMLLLFCLVAASAVWDNGALAQTSDTLFSAEELDDLLAPIALYPDPLIAQILPAATFIDQIDEAARYVRQYGQNAPVDDLPWDVSVRAVAHYPSVLLMMDQKYDWTVSLGQAFVNQEQDVMDAIQRLRAEALAAGNLVSTPQQQVIVEEGYIQIVPAEPEVIYIPVYDPVVVYAEPPPAFGFVTFSIGFTIGAWLNRDCDWHRHRVYYHGWRGEGWIGRARPYIPVRNNVYINNSYRVVNVNRRVVQHDTVRYREEIRRNVDYRREHIRPVQPRGGRPREGGETRQPRLQPVSPASPPQGRPDNKDIYRGRDVRDARPASQTGYGGYGSGKDAERYRERGQTSRQNMRQSNRPAPAQRPAATGGRQGAPRPAVQPAPPQRQQRQQRQQR